MKTISIWLVGSFVVPLAILIVFAILYFLRYKKYLLHKNTYKDCQFLEDCWKGYIFACLWQEECRKGFKLWWYLLGSKYIDMVNLYSERCVYELDHLDRFNESNDIHPCFKRKAFMNHWNETHSMLFDRVKDSYGHTDWNSPYKFKTEFGDKPFGWMTVMIQSKIFELYKKESLLILRTKGYHDFSNFLVNNYDESTKYPHNAPFSIIASGEFHVKIMMDYSVEIGERLNHEVKTILGRNKIPKTESQIGQLKGLTEGFLLKGIFAGGGYTGAHCPGLSETRSEIFNLLEQAKVAN
jgi:hypothetical protein